jgi:hypothetical protein
MKEDEGCNRNRKELGFGNVWLKQAMNGERLPKKGIGKRKRQIRE